MPFKSAAQRRYVYAAEARGEMPEGTAEKWSAETPKGKKLPEYAEKDARTLRRLKRARKSKS
jgi:hypothetical protein